MQQGNTNNKTKILCTIVKVNQFTNKTAKNVILSLQNQKHCDTIVFVEDCVIATHMLSSVYFK